MILTMQTKLIAALGTFAVLMLLGLGIHAHGVHQGERIERAEWLAKESARKDAESALVRKRAERDTAMQTLFNLTNQKTSEDHEKELADVRSGAADDRAAADRAGGLRIPASKCDRPAGPAETAGAGGRDEAAAASVRLPPAIENGLWDLAEAADAVTAQARACQSWVRANGFYGPVATAP